MKKILIGIACIVAVVSIAFSTKPTEAATVAAPAQASVGCAIPCIDWSFGTCSEAEAPCSGVDHVVCFEDCHNKYVAKVARLNAADMTSVYYLSLAYNALTSACNASRASCTKTPAECDAECEQCMAHAAALVNAQMDAIRSEHTTNCIGIESDELQCYTMCCNDDH